jgi:HAD superfamily hydrolase (TIGR01509 family)
MSIRGMIFDLDGTLVDSALDFDLIRRQMGLPPKVPILEALDDLDDHHAERRWAILAQHELMGVLRATLFPGVIEFFHELDRRRIKRAVLTRNSRASALATLARFELEVHAVHAREDGPVKPDPAGIWRICETWGWGPDQCVMIGDYRFDIEAGRKAGAHTVLFTPGRKHSVLADHERADFTLHSFAEAAGFWDWLEGKDEGEGRRMKDEPEK